MMKIKKLHVFKTCASINCVKKKHSNTWYLISIDCRMRIVKKLLHAVLQQVLLVWYLTLDFRKTHMHNAVSCTNYFIPLICK